MCYGEIFTELSELREENVEVAYGRFLKRGSAGGGWLQEGAEFLLKLLDHVSDVSCGPSPLATFDFFPEMFQFPGTLEESELSEHEDERDAVDFWSGVWVSALSLHSFFGPHLLLAEPVEAAKD